MKTVIIDTGCANINSLKFAIERLGYDVDVSQDEAQIRAADKLFLPGVGHAKQAMENLKARGLDVLIPTLTQPLLGICLGMQLLFSRSQEGEVDCLNIIPGDIKRMSPEVRLPHMGWNTLSTDASSPLLEGILPQDYVYFVHSYALDNSDYTLAKANYGQDFSAIVQRNNFYGMQFHPERSGPVGSRLLKNFLERV